MNFFKNLKDKIKIIFRGREQAPEPETEEEKEVTGLVALQSEISEKSEKEKEIAQENQKLENKIREAVKKYNELDN